MNGFGSDAPCLPDEAKTVGAWMRRDDNLDLSEPHHVTALTYESGMASLRAHDRTQGLTQLLGIEIDVVDLSRHQSRCAALAAKQVTVVLRSSHFSYVFMILRPALRLATLPLPPGFFAARFFAAVIRPPLVFFMLSLLYARVVD